MNVEKLCFFLLFSPFLCSFVRFVVVIGRLLWTGMKWLGVDRFIGRKCFTFSLLISHKRKLTKKIRLAQIWHRHFYGIMKYVLFIMYIHIHKCMYDALCTPSLPPTSYLALYAFTLTSYWCLLLDAFFWPFIKSFIDFVPISAYFFFLWKSFFLSSISCSNLDRKIFLRYLWLSFGWGGLGMKMPLSQWWH